MTCLSNWISAQLNSVLRLVHAQLIRYPLHANRRRQLLIRRFNISTIIDIGANKGQFGVMLRQHGYQGRLWSFEPLPTAYASLKKKALEDTHWLATNCAVSDQEGSIEFHVAKNSESSSALLMLPRHLEAAASSETIETIRVKTTTLKSILEEVRGENIMLKIDTQGYEDKVLLSGISLVAQVALIELEMSLAPLYEGQMQFRELDKFLLHNGFKLSSISEGFYDQKTGELLQFDAIYENSALRYLQSSHQ